MSSILKALKKVENEKGAFKGGTSPISRDLLCEITRPGKRSGSRTRLALIFLILLGGGGLAGVLLMQNEKVPPTQPLPSVVEIAPVAAPEVPVAGSVAALEATAEPPAVEPKAETPPSAAATPDTLKIAEEVVLTTREATAALKDTATTLRDTADALKNKVIVSSQAAIKRSAGPEKKSVAVPTAQAPPVPVAVARPLPVVSSTTVSESFPVPVSGASRNPGWHLSQTGDSPAPDLKISEIHWRPVAKDRLAVVNDLPVLEGVDIEDARVDRIFKDRIRFIVNGRYLEVKITSGTGH